MSDPAYVVHPKVLREAERRMAIDARRRPAKGSMPGGDGFLEMQIPLAHLVNAVAGHGVSVHDDAYWRENAARIPGCVVPYTSRSFSLTGAGCARGTVRTRFGVATRYRYGVNHGNRHPRSR